MFFSGFGVTGKLIPLAIGVAFLIWSMRNKGVGVTLAKYTGYFIIAISLIALLFGGVNAMKFYKHSKIQQKMMWKNPNLPKNR